jgi:hypothetical protein
MVVPKSQSLVVFDIGSCSSLNRGSLTCLKTSSFKDLSCVIASSQ